MDIREIVNYAGFFIGILGIVLSIYLFKKGTEVKDPRYYYKNFKNIDKLSDEDDSKIKITYGKDEVSRVFTTEVWIWNNGKKPIHKADIPPQSIISFYLRDQEFTPRILDYEVIKVSRPEINFSATCVHESTLIINFDFLDQNDGAVLEIQHTGSSGTEVKSDGIILGVPDGFKGYRTNYGISPFLRSMLKAISILDIKNYIKNPKAFYLFSVVLLAIIVGMLGHMIYSLTLNPTFNATTDNLQESILSEFPRATEKNINNILENINKNKSIMIQYVDKYSKFIFVIFMAFYLWVSMEMLVIIARREIVTPYPKSLNLADDLNKLSQGK